MKPITVKNITKEKKPLYRQITTYHVCTIYILMVTKPFWEEPNLRWDKESKREYTVLSMQKTFSKFINIINMGVYSYSVKRNKIDIQCI